MGEATGLAATPLHAEHERLGGKMVPFAGFELPVQYPAGILAEHRAVREAAGLFDVSHMGEFEVRGPQALELIQRVTTNDAARLEAGQAQYTVLCNESGHALDDCLVYRLADRYMIVVNAANRAKDFAWIERHAAEFDAELRDQSDAIALLALQGPRAQPILSRLTDHDLDRIGYYRFAEAEVADRAALVSRTGYTGEDGFELYLEAEDAVRVWRALLDSGAEQGLMPAGLGARDSLRLEVGYILYGNDLDESRTPLEAGLGWVVKLEKGEFIGRDALRRQKEQGPAERLVGFELTQRGFPRPGYGLRFGGDAVGTVTSGVLSPSLERGIGLGYLPAAAREPGTEIEVDIRGRGVPARVVRPPFYAGGSIRK